MYAIRSYYDIRKTWRRCRITSYNVCYTKLLRVKLISTIIANAIVEGNQGAEEETTEEVSVVETGSAQ